ncbi:MAG: hypothetical protein GY849_08450 [Deltaproteobacteria bacterium]|nr:hypothetical protein [Deltaproteobacteria bacterium]
MTFIPTVSPGKATGETAEAYKHLAQVAGHGMVPKIVQAFSLRPGSMRLMIRKWELAMWMGEAPRAMREMVAAVVSRFNACAY